MLGECYYHGIGVEEDEHEAVMWTRKAAEQGQASAQFNLGWSYMTGTGVAQDENQGLRWFRRAASQGLPEAISALKKSETSTARSCPIISRSPAYWRPH